MIGTSKIACWAIFFDLIQESALLRRHVLERKVIWGVNHEMGDFKQQRPKNLDLVIARPGNSPVTGLAKDGTLGALAAHWGVVLSSEEQQRMQELPLAVGGSVGSVLVALEAKAAMTAHQRALPRLYDELNSSHSTVHASSDAAAAAAFVMVNVATTFLSSDSNKWSFDKLPPHESKHKQPRDARLVIEKVEKIPRRNRPGDEGYDAIGVVVVDCRNDGSPITIATDPPAPADYGYDMMVRRLAHTYDTRFGNI